MSRKWERMVRKNTKTVNTQRKKQGAAPINGTSLEDQLTYRGRSWVLALFLLAIGALSLAMFPQFYGKDPMYLVTAGLYVVLAFIVYFMRRPYLRIRGRQISSRRFGGERSVSAEQIKSIRITGKEVSFSFTSSKAPWIFSRLFHRIDIDAMTPSVKEFADRNSIPVEQ